MRQRAAAVLLISAIVSTACGSNLSADEVAGYEAGLAASHQRARSGGANTSGPTSGTANGTTAGTPNGTAGTDPATPLETTTSDEQTATTTTTPPGSSPGSGTDTPGQAPATAGAPSGEAPTSAAAPASTTADTRAAPPGGNGGATETGVTGDSITVFNVVDRTGAVPGLFQDAQEATQAYLLKFASEEGTVYGRSINMVARDSKLSTQENRAAYLDACEQAFAAVGSMSAFEQGAADPIANCAIPDLRATAVHPDMLNLPYVRSALGQTNGVAKLAEWEYIKQEWPDAIKDAAFLYVDNATTTYQQDLLIRATTKYLDYEWDLSIPIALSEVNYSSIIQRVKDAESQVVIFMGAYQQAVRVAETMQQQEYTPSVYFLQANMYLPGLIAEGGEDMEGYTILGQSGAILEEVELAPELQEYAEWLARVNPRAAPTGLGMYAWGATKMFVESLKGIGPNLTRQALLDYLNANYTSYTAGGLFPPQNVATQWPSDCIVILDVAESGFSRRFPSEPGSSYCSEHGPGDVRDS